MASRPKLETIAEQAIAGLGGEHRGINFERILQGDDALVSSYSGVVERLVDLRFATKRKALSGQGTFKYGARYCAPNHFHAVHASSDIDLASREASQGFVGFGGAIQPRVRYQLQLDLLRVLDCREATTRRLLRVKVQQLRSCPWKEVNDAGQIAFTQVIGLCAFLGGFDALVVPSQFRPFTRGHNVVVIRENAPRDAIRVLGRTPA